MLMPGLLHVTPSLGQLYATTMSSACRSHSTNHLRLPLRPPPCAFRSRSATLPTYLTQMLLFAFSPALSPLPNTLHHHSRSKRNTPWAPVSIPVKDGEQLKTQSATSRNIAITRKRRQGGLFSSFFSASPAEDEEDGSPPQTLLLDCLKEDKEEERIPR